MDSFLGFISVVLAVVFLFKYKKKKNNVQTEINSNDNYARVVYDDAPPTCPYCKILLEKRPKRKTKCPNCKKIIYSKYRPNDKVYRLVTESEKEQIEKEWAEESSRKWKEKWIDELSRYGISELDFKKANESLSKKFGKVASNEDTVWMILNRLVLVNKDIEVLRSIYYTQVNFLRETGRNSGAAMKSALKLELASMKNNGVPKVEILSSNNSCDNCKKENGKIYNIDEAIAKNPLPNKNCTDDNHGFCRCCYLPVIDD